MKIVMLGHSGVGKTTFMACMYAVLQSPVGDFSVIAGDEDLHDRLMAIAEAVVAGEYPPPTTSLSEYPLTLLHDGEPVLDFEWLDYRGGALNEASSSRELVELQEALENADGVIAFFDGVALNKGGRVARNAVARLMVVLQNAVNNEDCILPIALVVTKADALDGADEIIEQIMPLAKLIAESRSVFGALIFTACAKNILSNVEKPTLFVLHKGLQATLFRMRTEFEALAEAGRQYSAKAGLWDWIDSKLSGVATYGEMAERRFRSANDMIDRHNALVNPANELSETLTDIDMF